MYKTFSSPSIHQDPYIAFCLLKSYFGIKFPRAVLDTRMVAVPDRGGVDKIDEEHDRVT